MNPQKRILVVDDQPINRKILFRFLSNAYTVLEAENGRQALDILNTQGETLSAVLLDLVMPDLDGYDVLKTMQRDPTLSAIPVIVVSQSDKGETEAKALQLGARDFISKPYNPGVLRRRLANLIELHESNLCIGRIEHDTLTGTYNKDAFCRRAAEMISEHPTHYFLLVATDIERFKLINDSFGTAEGDKLLHYVGQRLQAEMQKVGGICARHSADHFVALVPTSADDGGLHSVIKRAEEDINGYPLKMHITLKFGIYPVNDLRIPVSLMCDRALLASDSAKNRYDHPCAYYDDTIRQKLLLEQQITDEMKRALKRGQFQVYLQPKYDLLSERIAGAEALVRWMHPKLGFLAPDAFIPLFEKNGFITELDNYVWDQTCRLIADWIARGGKYVPVSVNVSRRDIYRENLPELFSALVKKYGLQPCQLHLEITETAYAENPAQLISVVSRLKKLGFTIEMDDFGSGYSSLNMLSELPIDVLKLDMHLIQRETGKKNDRNILSFIISLAKWMNLLVVAEGVETRQQVEVLRNLDCNYVQGYYYAKPMPAEKFTYILLHSNLADPISADRETNETDVTLPIHERGEIMVIADKACSDRSALAEYFQNIYTVVETENTEDAYACIQKYFDQVSVLLLDTSIAGQDRDSFIKKLRANALYRDIPVILTGCGDERQAFAQGASEFLTKPYHMDIALHRVQNVTAHNTIQLLEREKQMLSRIRTLSQEVKMDAMTGLLNRTEMENQIEELLSREKHGIFMTLDIDNFKTINDTYGHGKGDTVLLLVTETLRQHTQSGALLCRMGGDEFAVFIPARLTRTKIEKMAARLLNALELHVENINLSCSVGISVAPENGESYKELYHNADMALLTAKRLGKNQFQFYDGLQELPDRILYRNLDWILDEASDAVYICDADSYELFYVNDVVSTWTGKSKKQCMGKPCYRAIWGLDHPCNHCVPLEKMERSYCEHEFEDAGQGRHFITKGKLVDWGDRKARIQYVQDNTHRAKLLHQMEELSEDRRLLLDLLPGGLLRYQAYTHSFSFVSESTLHMLGYTRPEFEAQFSGSYDNFIYEADRGIAPALRGEYANRTYRIRRRDGSLASVYETAYFHPTPTGGETYVMLTDVTEQHAVEEENRRLTERLEAVVNNVPGGVCLYQSDGRTITPLLTSREYLNLMGLTDEENRQAFATNDFSLVTPEYRADFTQGLRAAFADGGYLHMVYRCRHAKTGKLFWVSLTGSVVPQEDGSRLGFVAYADATQQMRREEKLEEVSRVLQEQRDMLSAAMAHSGILSWEYNFETKTAELCGHTQQLDTMPERLSPMPEAWLASGKMDASYNDAYCAMLHSLRNNESASLKVELLRPGEKTKAWYKMMYTVIRRNQAGEPLLAIGTAIDISEQKLAEQRYDEEVSFLASLSSKLVSAFRIDLTTGLVEEAHSALYLVEDPLHFVFSDDSLTDLCRRFIPNEEERRRCREMMIPSRLLKDFETGITEQTCEYAVRLKNGRLCWISMQLKMMRKPGTEKVTGFFSFWNIHQEKMLEKVVQALIKTEYDAICTIDAATGYPSIFHGDIFQRIRDRQRALGDSEAGVVADLQATCYPPDLERAVAETKIQFVRQALSHTAVHTVTYREDTGKGLRSKRVEYRYLDESHTTILCTIQTHEEPFL